MPDGRPIMVGRCFTIVSEDSQLEAGERILIRLSRGQAFGSGLHETTVSCIEAIEGLPSVENKTVLDVGTGTGILSLAALFLGAKSAMAFDTDEDAAASCHQNAAINGLNQSLKVFQGTLDAVKPTAVFDIVLANIYGDIILENSRSLAAHTREGGHLILSGLDYTDSWPLKTSMGKLGMQEVSVLFLKDYVTQVWHHPLHRAPGGP